ncbi:MAG: hypothetical protein JXQ23_00920, partial [Clostridia bacterium]|nr:hypothetical protein [Clostridia bacterium]
MKSKEKMLSVIKEGDTGHIPCSIYFNNNLTVEGYDLSKLEDKIKAYLELGSEPVIDVELPLPKLHDQVRVKVWEESVQSEKYPILYKEYVTPEGTIRQGEKKTKDWLFKKDIPHPGNDHTTSNLYEPLIKDDNDIKALRYLWQLPDDRDIKRIYEKNRDKFALAEKYGVLTRATIGQG